MNVIRRIKSIKSTLDKLTQKKYLILISILLVLVSVGVSFFIYKRDKCVITFYDVNFLCKNQNSNIIQSQITTTNNQSLNNLNQITTSQLDENLVNDANHNITVDLFFDNVINYDIKNDLEIVMTGDTMLGRAVNYNTIKSGDINWPFINITDQLKKYSLVITNLENPLITNCRLTLSGMVFCGDLAHADALKNANIKLLSLANNHSLNYGKDGLDQTVKVLSDIDLIPFGVTNPVIYEHNGYKIALLGFDDIECNPKYIECVSDQNIVDDLALAKSLMPDLIVVVPHWGSEYTDKPNTRQIKNAKLMIDNGADIILGNHPHWVQSIEVYKNKLIVYSHGNFVFDQMWSQKTRQGVIGRYIFNKKGLLDGEFIPIYIKNYGQVQLADTQMAKAILNQMYLNSKE